MPAFPIQLFQEKNYYWVRQKRLGLFVYNPENDNFQSYNSRGRNQSFFFEKSSGYDGVFITINHTTVFLIQYDGNRFSETEICAIPAETHERIRALYDDGQGNLWIGTTYNLFKYGLKEKRLDKVCENIGRVNAIISLNDGSIYLTTEAEGLWKVTSKEKRLIHAAKENYSVLAVSPDRKVWIGTLQGNIYCYDPNADSFTSQTENCGLIGDAIIDLVSDDAGNMWILTEQKITVYNPEKNVTSLINCSDPSIPLENFSSLYKGENGEMHVGGMGGIVILTFTDRLEEVAGLPAINLTSIKINNVQRLIPGNNKKVTLQPHERHIELFFSTFDALNTGKIRYAFRQQQDSQWNYLPVGQNSIYLAGLSKGDYPIEVRATDGNGIWTEDAVTIHIQRLPAWYETWWAYLLYVLIVLAVVVFILQKYIRSQKEKQQKEMEEQVSQMKYRFFTNVSHELRTPLTLVITPLETIIKKIPDATVKKQLESVNKNARHLLSLVNQLLDFRKVEMGGETLSLTKGDINAFVSSAYENFQLVSEEKNIDFSYHTDISSRYLFFDAGKLRKVLNNLLSNAFKFTEAGGSISLSLLEEKQGNTEDTDYIVISVKDTGRGIPESELSTIFERFHQVQGQENTIGSGIGLHIVREYVGMHQGTVSVQSQPAKGSIFTVSIPANLKPDENATVSGIEKAVAEQQGEEENPLLPSTADLEKKILIVEDNTEFRSYLKDELSRFYTVYEAADGLEGEKEALGNYPDVIITDLMMPGIDGIELTRRIKNNIAISHTPVILLTANDNIENEKRGYKEGADAYIPKPFDWDILLTRIENLMAQKVQRQQAFEKEVEVHPEDITISSLDEKLVRKALELIEINLGNSEYSIEDLSNDMYMSRSNLYRKIHSITGLTPTDFVRNIRLKKAAELLIKGEMTVEELAYTVGFSSPGYFAKSFKKMFGVPPTQYNRK